MAQIDLPAGYPGLLSLWKSRPDTAKPMRELLHTLLRGPSTLSPGERELIAAYVSSLNECRFQAYLHASAARFDLGDDRVAGILQSFNIDNVADKLGALLLIATRANAGGQLVFQNDVDKARSFGATDQEIHDTVLIAATTCMLNRYVDGLGAPVPEDVETYDNLGERIQMEGYLGL